MEYPNELTRKIPGDLMDGGNSISTVNEATQIVMDPGDVFDVAASTLNVVGGGYVQIDVFGRLETVGTNH